MLDATTVAVLTVVTAGLLGWSRHQGTRRADLPGLLQALGLALTTLAAVFAVPAPATGLTSLLLAPAAGSLVAAGVCRTAEELGHAAVVEQRGGPVLRRSRAGIAEIVAAAAVLAVGVPVLATGQHGPVWALLLPAVAVGVLLGGRLSRAVADRVRARAAAGYEHELAFWAWELSEDRLAALELRLENARLARLVGLAPLLAPEPVPARPHAMTTRTRTVSR